MADLRRYTTTPRPQLAWTAVALVALALAAPAGGTAVAAVVGGWLLGLVAVGVHEWRHWTGLVADSGFERRGGGSREDIERLVEGRSVTVETDLAGPLAGTHATVATPVEDVDASFTVAVTTEGLGVDIEGLDDRYAVQGAEENVDAVLSGDVRAALNGLGVPGTLTVTGDRVAFEVPFTRLTAAELDRVSALVVAAAERVESVATD